MTERISISATADVDFIFERLNHQFTLLRQRGINIDLFTREVGEYKIIDCVISSPDSDYDIFEEDRIALCRHHIANTIADMIVEKWRGRLVSQIIDVNYQCFNPAEKNKVYSRSLELLQEQEVNINLVAAILNWKKEIAERVLDFLKTSNRLIIDGFVNFRLKDFRIELEQAVDEAVEEYLLEKEYDDFIRLLKYFVEVQEPKVEKVHVVLRNSGNFELFDHGYNIIDNEYLESLMLDMVDSDLTYEDLLISALITIAPNEVIVHLPEYSSNYNSIATIQRIFDESVTLCNGCSKCLHSRQKKF